MREQTGGPTALVGRRQERRALDAALDRAVKFSAPQFLTLLGPAGIGKSRLLTEWTDGLRARGGFRVARAGALRAGRDGAGPDKERFSLVGRLLRERLGLTGEIDQEAVLEVFRGELQHVFGDRRVAEVAAFLGPFLGLDLPQGPLAHSLTDKPESYEEVARAVLVRFLEEDARLTPLVIALDDVDAADDASIELVGRIAGSLGEAPLVVVTAARPELFVRCPDWGRWGGSHSQVELTPLSNNDLTSLLVAAIDPAVLTQDIDAIVERAAGNPGALLQILRPGDRHAAERKSKTVWGGDGSMVSVAPGFVASPGEPVRDQRSAQFAGLSPAERDLLARGAAFGPCFPTGGVIALGRMGGPPSDPTTVFGPDATIEEVRRMLAVLAERELITRVAPDDTSIAGETEWQWRDGGLRALVLGAADPENARRRRLFAAQWLEGRMSLADLSDRFEQLGDLYQEGGDVRRAGECFVAAGDRARDDNHLEAARALYLRGVRLLTLDDSVFKMEALHKLGDTAARVGHMREALAHFSEMLHLAWRLDLPAKGGAAHARIGRLHRGLGNYKLAHRHLDMGRLLFELAGDVAGVAACFDDIGRVQMLLSNVDEAMHCHKAALRLREQLGDDRGKALTLSWLGLCEVQRGDLLAAERCFSASLQLSRRENDARGIAFALMDLSGIERELRRPDRARARLEEARQLVRELQEPMSEALLGIQIGECLLQAQCARDAAREFAAARALAEKFGAKRLVSQALRGLAEAELAGAGVVAARDLAEDALRVAEQIGVPVLIGAALRVMAGAEAAGAPGDPDRGGPRELFDRAVALLSERGADLELGRTLSAYAAFEERTGREAAANELRGQAAGIHARSWNAESVGLFDRI